jgi:hypothetical protein
MISTKSVRNEIITKANNKASSKGWELCNIRMLTDHPDDHYLMVTRCKVKGDEWAVHLYNSNDDAFYEGYYTGDNFKSIDKYWDKR